MHVSNVMTAVAVIIGGGVMGTATAFQMAKAGLDVIDMTRVITISIPEEHIEEVRGIAREKGAE